MIRESLARAAAATEAALPGWRLDRLRAELDRPLLLVAAGATLPAARLWARLHERTGHPAWARSTHDALHRPVPEGAAVVMLSGSGRHHDVLTAARHLGDAAKGHLRAVVCLEGTPLADLTRGLGGDAVVLPTPPPAHGLFHPAASVPMLTLAAALHHPGPFHAQFDQAVSAPTPAARPPVVVALGVGLAAPAAEAFAVRVREAGLCPAWHSSLRDLGHGSFLALPPGAWVVAFALGSQVAAARAQLALLPPDRPASLLSERADDAGGALGLFGQGLVTLSAALSRFEVRPTRADVPDWGARLYRAAL